MISNLPRDLIVEILSRVPLASVRKVQSTCKHWHSLYWSYKNKLIAETSSKDEKEVMILKDRTVYLLNVNLRGVNRNIDPSAKCKGKLTRLDKDNSVQVVQFFRCNGLILCVVPAKFCARLVVWNPYYGKTRWIRVQNGFSVSDKIAFGYDSFRGRHKILKVIDGKLEIYELGSNSWRNVHDTTPLWSLDFGKRRVSLKGNTYWFARDMQWCHCFLLCFDFTSERFGPRLPVPCEYYLGVGDNVSLSTVREEQLCMLIYKQRSFNIEIWVTDKIECDAVSWSNFLRVDMMPIDICFRFENFMVDEEKKVVVVFGQQVYVIGENGYFRTVQIK